MNQKKDYFNVNLCRLQREAATAYSFAFPGENLRNAGKHEVSPVSLQNWGNTQTTTPCTWQKHTAHTHKHTLQHQKSQKRIYGKLNDTTHNHLYILCEETLSSSYCNLFAQKQTNNSLRPAVKVHTDRMQTLAINQHCCITPVPSHLLHWELPW